ncbi:MAG: hypothetical protein R3F11_30340 [Verrucomicrobiales bacterium]
MKDRLTPFVALFFAAATMADATTSWICIHKFGYDEANPLTDTTSLWSLLKPEIPAWIGGIIAVRLGFWLVFRRQNWTGAASFAEFRAHLLALPNAPGAFLVLVPIAFAFGRLLPVFSNAAMIAFGDSGYDQLLGKLTGALEVDFLEAYALSQVAIFAILIYPVAFLVHRMTARKSEG